MRRLEMDISEIKNDLKKRLSAERYAHSLSTAETAADYAEFYHADTDEAYLAGLVHDCAKYHNPETMLSEALIHGIEPDALEAASPALLHARLGAVYAKERYGITNEDILSAIRWHTTGRENMSLLEKLIFLADLTEPTRTYGGIDDIRNMVKIDLDRAMIMSFDGIIEAVLRKKALLHFDTVKARNYLLRQQP